MIARVVVAHRGIEIMGDACPECGSSDIDVANARDAIRTGKDFQCQECGALIGVDELE